MVKGASQQALAEAVAESTGHRFRDPELLARALTHASARDQGAGDYQRLEFLGDRVLGLVIAEMLFEAFPDATEGELSVRLNSLVNAQALAAIGEETGIAELIRAGSEIGSRKGRKRVNLRADVMEAVIAAIYLEGGLGAARTFIRRYWEALSLAVDAGRNDPKTALQEWAHQVCGQPPVYTLEKREGPDHDPLFTVSVEVGAFAPGRGSGRSKRRAEQAAATEMLEREGVWQRAEEVS